MADDHLPTKKVSPGWQISSKGKVTGRQPLDSLAFGSDVSRTSCPALMGVTAVCSGHPSCRRVRELGSIELGHSAGVRVIKDQDDA